MHHFRHHKVKEVKVLKSRAITLDMILSATSLTRSRSETNEAYLDRVTHLHLQGKRLKKIEKLEMCSNLKVLYLYDNQIEAIENIGFASILQYLYLQNNLIQEIPPLTTLTNLTKLILDQNSIQYVTGLESCTKLEELHISDQKLPQFTSLDFDPVCLESFSKSLKVLDVSGNGIRSLLPFFQLQYLVKFLCSNNNVSDMSHAEQMVALPMMSEASFNGNPCCKINRYRDMLIGSSSDTLATLDEIPILRHQQIAIKGLQGHRSKLGLSNPGHEEQPAGGEGNDIPESADWGFDKLESNASLIN